MTARWTALWAPQPRGPPQAIDLAGVGDYELSALEGTETDELVRSPRKSPQRFMPRRSLCRLTSP